MRDPSIHITESKLAKILSEVFEDLSLTVNYQKLAKDIVKRSKNSQLTNRKLVVSNEKLFKKATTVVKSNVGDVELLNTLI